MAPQHIITRSYDNLKGFSTDSIYLRPSYVAERAVNMHRNPDGSFGPRRGYQCEIADIGGMGLTAYDNPCRCGIELVCLNDDGSLYRRIERELRIEYTAPVANPDSYFLYTIFVDPRFLQPLPGWSLSPWSISPWAAPGGESITFNGWIKRAAIVNGNQSNVNTINVQAGHIVAAGDVISVLNQQDNTIQTRLVTAVGATSITFSGPTLSVENTDRVDIFFELLFGRGFDVGTPVTITTFLAYLNTIGVPAVRSGCLLAYTTGTTNFPAAFIPIQEPTSLVTGQRGVLNYFYWSKIPSPVTPILPGSNIALNQNSADFENAVFAIFDGILYCSNGYDFPVKYDGQNAYLAGMPKADKVNVTDNSAGDIPDGVYEYAITYEQKDKGNHIVEGEIADGFTFTVSGGPRRNNVIINNLDSSTGYNTNGALAIGGPATLYGPDNEGFYYNFVAVAAGHTFLVGDVAYYRDTVYALVVGGPAATTRIPVLAGYGARVGDIIYFVDNTGVLRQRQVVDIDTIPVNNLLEISGGDVDVSNNPQIYAYTENDVYGHIAIADGSQNNVTTFNVLAGHNIALGDTIFFTNPLREREIRVVTGVGATTVSFAYAASIVDGELIASNTIDTNQITLKSIRSGAINLGAGEPLSNNLRINIWRTLDGGTEYRIISQIPNNSFAATQTYIDDMIDSELGFRFGNPQRLPNPPPKAKYILTYQNMMIYAGGSRDPDDTETSLDAFYFSEGNQPEVVPAATNFVLLPSNDDIISGVGISGSSLVLFKDRSIYSISGDLLTSQFQVTPVAPGSNIGCVAHATIRAVGGLLYFLHSNGLYSMAEMQMFPTDAFGNPVPLSKPIDSIFRETSFEVNKRFILKRAIAINYTQDNEYWLFLPCEEQSGSARNANSFSRVFCYDYSEKNWFEWNQINAAGGFATIGEDVYWQERRFSGYVGNTANLYRQHRHYRLIDYADHAGTIPVSWFSSWEDLNYPQVRKKFIRCMLLLDRINSLYQVNVPPLVFSSYLDRVPGLRNTMATVTTVNQSTRWGSAWSWTKWSGLVDSFIRIPLRNGTVAKSMQISLEMNALNQSFRLMGFQLEIAPEFQKTFVR